MYGKSFLKIATKALAYLILLFSSLATAAVTPPTAQTNSATGIGQTTATLSGVITANGGANITEYGFFWGSGSNLSTKKVVGSNGLKGTSYTYNLTGLTPGSTYSYKFYAVNSAGTGYGSVTKFTMPSPSSPSSKPTPMPTSDIPVRGVSVSKKSITMAVGDTASLTAGVSPSNATDKRLTWDSNNKAVAKVDGNGNVKAVAQGTAVISVVSAANRAKYDHCTVTVSEIPPNVSSVNVNPASITAWQPVAFSASTDRAASRVVLSFPDAGVNLNMNGSGTNWNWSGPINQAGSRRFVVTAYDESGKNGSTKGGSVTVNPAVGYPSKSSTKSEIVQVDLPSEKVHLYVVMADPSNISFKPLLGGTVPRQASLGINGGYFSDDENDVPEFYLYSIAIMNGKSVMPARYGGTGGIGKPLDTLVYDPNIKSKLFINQYYSSKTIGVSKGTTNWWAHSGNQLHLNNDSGWKTSRRSIPYFDVSHYRDGRPIYRGAMVYGSDSGELKVWLIGTDTGCTADTFRIAINKYSKDKGYRFVDGITMDGGTASQMKVDGGSYGTGRPVAEMVYVLK
ncbi:Ig-like domain-containing protein [Geomonas sp. RF6]|uniref:Ig-like domain-containing protein n=1 Tax=Geomonas sp. RF6 TaxID=2897342 RepID=UPI001E37BAA5|nr:Ig-like domain-containing protein [Geomonas sp. RF6]UFS71712.1 Ig-like domain-containing protein [Geomonas sp. RF6]